MTNNKITDREEVLEAIKNGDYDLEFADDTLKADREVVLEALRNQGGVLEYASEELQNDPELKNLMRASLKNWVNPSPL